MKLRMDDICNQLVGKTLTDVEFGYATCPDRAGDESERFIPLPAKITKAWISTTEGDRDPCIRFELEDEEDEEGDDFYIYDNEEITVD